MTITERKNRSDTGANQGVGFAVPINSARRAMRQLVTRGRVDYAYVGVTTEDLTPSLRRPILGPAHRFPLDPRGEGGRQPEEGWR